MKILGHEEDHSLVQDHLLVCLEGALSKFIFCLDISSHLTSLFFIQTVLQMSSWMVLRKLLPREVMSMRVLIALEGVLLMVLGGDQYS